MPSHLRLECDDPAQVDARDELASRSRAHGIRIADQGTDPGLRGPLTSTTPNLAGQSVASLKPAALTACWAALGPRTAHGRVLDVG